MKPKRSDVWLVRFPFSDLGSSKVRPALVLAVHGEDLIVAGIFSRKLQTHPRSTWVLIEDGDRDFPRTKLKKTSVLKAEKIAVIHKSVLKKKLGFFSASLMKQVDQALKSALYL